MKGNNPSSERHRNRPSGIDGSATGSHLRIPEPEDSTATLPAHRMAPTQKTVLSDAVKEAALASPALAQFVRRLPLENLPIGSAVRLPSEYLDDAYRKKLTALNQNLTPQSEIGFFRQHSSLQALFSTYGISTENINLSAIQDRPELIRFLEEHFYNRTSAVVMGATGCGKTFAAALASEIVNASRSSDGREITPLSANKPLRIFLTPQDELAQDFLNNYASKIYHDTSFIGVITGSTVSPDKRKAVYDSCSQVVATPETLLYDIQAGRVDPNRVSLVEMDEVHRLINRSRDRTRHPAESLDNLYESDYAYRKLLDIFSQLKDPPRFLGFSATPGDNYERQGNYIQKLFGRSCNFCFLGPAFSDRQKVIIQVPAKASMENALVELDRAVFRLLRNFRHQFKSFPEFTECLDPIIGTLIAARTSTCTTSERESMIASVFGQLTSLREELRTGRKKKSDSKPDSKQLILGVDQAASDMDSALLPKELTPDFGIPSTSQHDSPNKLMAYSHFESILEVARQRRELVQFGPSRFLESMGKRIWRVEQSRKDGPIAESAVKRFVKRTYSDDSGGHMRKAFELAAGGSPFNELLNHGDWRAIHNSTIEDIFERGRSYLLASPELLATKELLEHCFCDQAGMYFTNRRSNTEFVANWLNRHLGESGQRAIAINAGRERKDAAANTQDPDNEFTLLVPTQIYEEGKDIQQVSFLLIPEATSDSTRNSQREGRLRSDGLIVYLANPETTRSLIAGFKAQIDSRTSFTRVMPEAGRSKRGRRRL